MKKKKKKKIKNKIKSQEPAVEQQREEVSSTFGWYFPGQILLKSVRGFACWQQDVSCSKTLGHTALGAGAQAQAG